MLLWHRFLETGHPANGDLEITYLDLYIEHPHPDSHENVLIPIHQNSIYIQAERMNPFPIPGSADD